MRLYRNEVEYLSEKIRSEENKMEQYFGASSMYSSYQYSNPHSPSNISLLIERTFEKLGNMCASKKFLLLFLILLFIELIVSLFRFQLGNMLSSLLLLIVGGKMFARHHVSEYTSERNYYLANATVTLKVLCKHLPFTRKFFDYAEDLFLFSIVLWGINLTVLSYILFGVIVQFIFVLSFCCMLLGGIICFAKREMNLLANGLFGVCFFIQLMVVLRIITGEYMSVFATSAYFISWILASNLKTWKIKDIKVYNPKNNEKEIIDNRQQ